jgi:predicted enzyme related to lactoylglutathione lyase
MSEVTSYNEGEFCWAELATTDQEAAKKFYTSLFGWHANDQPMGPDSVYTMLELKGKTAAALYTQDKAQSDFGIPPHWNIYIAVDNVDATAKKITELGGKFMAEPFDVMDLGRMAIATDPEGAMFAIWQAKRHIGATIREEANAFCWYEVSVNDTGKEMKFYEGLFGWGAKESPEYTEWTLADKSIGGMMKLQADWGPVPPHWMGCVMVESVEATMEKAISLGAKSVVPPMDIPDMGRYAIFSDPQGANLAIFAPKT